MRTQDKDAAIQFGIMVGAGTLLIFFLYEVGTFVLNNPWVVALALLGVAAGLYALYRKRG